MKKPLPPRDLAWFDPATGRPTDIFFDWAQSIDARVLREPVSIASTPANGQFLVYSTDDGAWSLQPSVAQADTEVLIWDNANGVWVAGAN